MIVSRARGQSQVKPSAGLQFRFEAKHKVYIGRLCWCLCKNYKQIFLVSEDSGAVLVSEDSGAADVGDPCAQPDPRVLRFISAADFKQGLQRANEMMQTFKKKATISHSGFSSSRSVLSQSGCGRSSLRRWMILRGSASTPAGQKASAGSR